MDTQTPDLDAVVKRLEKVEAQNRKLKRAGVLILALVCAAVLMGQTLPRGETVEADRFLLIDGEGKVRAVLGFLFVGYRSPFLALTDSDGQTCVELVAEEDGSRTLALLDKDQNTRAMLMLSKDGTPSLAFADADGHLRAVLGSTSLVATKTGAVTRTAPSSLVLFDKENKVIYQAP